MSRPELSPLSTSQRRALQPLFNAFDDVAADVWAGGCVLAVSGGPDSRALLEAFARWPRRPKKVVVVVVDHQRRAGSADEAAAVVVAAAAVGVVGVVKAVVVDKGGSAEAELRSARYVALVEAAGELGVDVVVTAHHKGDVAEGMLLHLAGRGGGRGGRAPHVVEGRGAMKLVRPFLDVTKATLRAALDELGVVDVVVDADDVAGKNARGWLRNKLLGPLEDARGDVEDALARFARHRRDDDDVLDALVPDAAAGDVVDGALAPAILRRWIVKRLDALVDDPRSSGAAVDDVLRLCAAGQAGAVDLKGARAEIRVGDRGALLALTVAHPQTHARRRR